MKILLRKSKQDCKNPPVLHLLDKKGRFHLYSDRSQFATGTALYQVQDGKPKLIANESKRMSEAI